MISAYSELDRIYVQEALQDGEAGRQSGRSVHTSWLAAPPTPEVLMRLFGLHEMPELHPGVYWPTCLDESMDPIL